MNQVASPASSDAAGPSRPWPLTWFCVLGWVALAAAALSVLRQRDAVAALALERLLGGLAALGLAATALLGYWLLRRWALWLALALLVARVAAGAAEVLPLRPGDLAWPFLLSLVGLVYYRRLR